MVSANREHTLGLPARLVTKRMSLTFPWALHTPSSSSLVQENGKPEMKSLCFSRAVLYLNICGWGRETRQFQIISLFLTTLKDGWKENDAGGNKEREESNIYLRPKEPCGSAQDVPSRPPSFFTQQPTTAPEKPHKPCPTVCSPWYYARVLDWGSMPHSYASQNTARALRDQK